MNHDELEPSVEVAHLRRLLDIQPACLLRLGADGTLLAANDAAVTMLGVTSRADALGRDITAWIPPDQHTRWRTFAGKVAAGAPSSIECDIDVSSGTRLTMLFSAVPLADHPDGVVSIVVAVRAVSGQRQVEAAIVELEEQLRERDGELLTARARLVEEETCRRQLAEKVAGLQAREEALAEVDEARKAAEASCARAQAEVRQLEMALQAFATRRQPAAVEAELEEARAARVRLEALVQKAQQAVAVLQQREREAVEQRDALQARLDEVQAGCRQREAERDTLQARLEQEQAICRERETELGRLKTAYRELEAAHAAATGEYDRLVGALRDQAAQIGALAGGLPQAGNGPRADAPSPCATAARTKERP